MVRTWLESWPVVRQLTDGRPDRPGCGGEEPHQRVAAPAGRHRGQGREVDLPVLRRRVRAERVREGRESRPDRGRPRLPDQPRAAVPEGLGDLPARHRPAPRARTVLYRRPYGTEWEDLDLDTAMDMIADRVDRSPATRAGRRSTRATRRGGRMGFASLGGATLDNEENYLIKKLFTALGDRSRSRTRRASDTAPRSPVWGHRSGAAAPPRSSRTCRTPTASSSRARTWPSATPSASSG